MTQSDVSATRGKGIHIALWVVQILLGLPFIAFGFMKVTKPVAELAAMMPWAGELPSFVVRGTGLIDMAGGLGLILPGLTRTLPQLTKFAALGIVALQVCAIVFHLVRGEAANTPLNLVFLALAGFIAWGRTTKHPL